MNKTFVIGHKNPDTDSICASVAYAELKNILGFKCEAKRLGTLNEETKFAFKTFNVEAPDVLKDARCRLEDVELDKAIEINKNDSCNAAYNLVVQTNNRTLFVCDNHKLIGIVSISDLTSIRLLNNKKREELLAKSSIRLIASDLNANIINETESFSINGKVSLYNPSIDLKERIILISNKEDLDKIDDNVGLVIYAGKEKVENKSFNLIETNMAIEDILRIIYEAIPVSLIMTSDYYSCNSKDYVDDVSSKIISTRFRCYPVIDDQGIIIGSISRYHLFNYKKHRFILVDHSSKSQTINNIDGAEIIEIVDHHHIGDITTTKPIYYRNQTCGCTCSIVYQLYKENNIVPRKEIAGLMLSAIISDTIYFISQTTTVLDINYAEELASIADVDLHDYAKKLLNASVKLKDADVVDIMTRDLKQYTFNGFKIAVGQTNYNNIQDVQSRQEEFKNELLKYQEDKGYHLLIMMFTSVKADGTLFYFFGPKSSCMFDILETKIDNHSCYDTNIISRKQQLIPLLSKALEQ